MKKLMILVALVMPFASMAQTKANASAKKEKSLKKETIVEIGTEYGTMKFKLYNETPLHRDNFIKLAKEGFYDGTLFHRVIKDFMIQGGDPESKNAAPDVMLGNGGPGYTVPAEFNASLIHKKGALAAARLGDQMNPQKASSGSQFYIVQGKPLTQAELNMMAARKKITYTPEQIKTYETVGGTPFLDMDYTVFGEMISGMEVLDKIAAVTTNPQNRPLQDIKMTVKVIE
ncbi:MAG: peptidylprolyl isomerase [Bacteroidetes bacterium]|jgi:peptidyl-prolyl cis-trans isomerase B (cyclophilin B)|nr:peptidylprolyl isomerase [Bacteroidota bacterium]